MILTTTASAKRRYYDTTTLCPFCSRLLPGEVFGRGQGVYLARECPEHGRIEGLVCSDSKWFEGLKRFDVTPIKPAHPQRPVNQGCPLDCGLCTAHRQVAGTVAIEISNRCNANCPVCLGDNRGTFEMTVAEIRELVEGAIQSQGRIGVLTLSGGEPTIHPQFFDILTMLDRPEIGRINLNSNGLRMVQDSKFVDRLRQHPKVYVSLHFDGRNAEQIRGNKPQLQEQALNRLCAAGIGVVPLILGVRDINDQELGTLVPALLQRSRAIKTVIVSLMAYMGANGGRFNPEPLRRLTIPDAIDSIAAGSGAAIHREDFIPVPMPNPICAAIGYFFVDDEGIIPMIRAAGVDQTVACIQNQHFAQANEKMEAFFREMINNIYANPRKFPGADRTLRRLKTFVARLFSGDRQSAAERQALAEESIKTVFIMQFMDSWTFDTQRLSKCSCQHLLPGNRLVPSCGYYAFHRQRDARFA
ncbi:MAG TPA: radical SAM protein [Verrucomicrobiae bacterium]|nr:radical SAM protein [Verrucomicrobiae bacterium]